MSESLWTVLFTISNPADLTAVASGSGTTGTIIAVVGSFLTVGLTIWGRKWIASRRPPAVLTPADSAAQLNYTNMVHELAAYKTWATGEFSSYRAEIIERDETIDWKDAVINTVDDECLELRGILTSAGITPPPRKPRPRRTP